MLRNAVVALVLGVPLSVLLLVPVAGVLYRREGRLAPIAIAQLVAGAVYFCALWAYTLLPTPPARELSSCAAPQLRPFAFVGDILRLGIGSPAAIVHNAALLQVVLNVALFVPLGVGVRLLLHRGVVLAGLLGLGGSLLIEVTQLTGIYGIYSCAYRLFDVDDLIANTAGALLGAAVTLPFVRSRRSEGVVLAAGPVRLGRRLVGLLADAVVIGAIQFVIGALWLAWAQVGGPDQRAVPDIASVTTWGVPAVVEFAAVVLAGRTVGEALVAISPGSPPGARWRQALVGAAGYCLLGLIGLEVLFAIVTVVAVVATKDRRGLSRLASGGRIVALVDARRARRREEPVSA